jgi:hypothetical protein
MEELSQEKETDIYDRIGWLGNSLNYLPFARLRSAKFHRFGALRLWPKKKVFFNKPKWEDFKYRPLVSFQKHRWKRLFALLFQL